MTSDDVVSEIERAFSDAPYPGDDHIVTPLVIDGRECRDLEREEIAAAFRGKSWDDLTREAIHFHYHALPFLTAEGFRYYLPAYLIAALDAEWVNRIFLIYQLKYPDKEQFQRLFLKQVRLLSPREKLAVCSFLGHLNSETTDPEERRETTAALDLYWGH